MCFRKVAQHCLEPEPRAAAFTLLPTLFRVAEKGHHGEETRPVAMTLTRESIADALVELRGASAELYDISRVVELLGWDQETMMPPRGVSPRALQQSTLSGVLHERLVRPRLGELLERLAEPAADPRSSLTDVERALVRETRRAHEREVKIPAELVKELASANSEAQETWTRARAATSWKRLRDRQTRSVATRQCSVT